MSGDNRSDNNRTSEGVGIFLDRSWIEKYSDKRPAAQRSAGFYANRYMKSSFDKDSGDVIEFRDEENDPMISIIEPLNLSYKIHEWNDLNKDPVSSPDSETQQSDDIDLSTEVIEDESVDADGKKLENAPGRVRPHSKVWAVNLIVDDKHVIESRLNRSTDVVRVSDYKAGDLDDLFQVREILKAMGDESSSEIDALTTTVVDDSTSIAQNQDYTTTVYEPKPDPVYRMMYLLNPSMNKEGGYIWRGDTPNLQQTKHVDKALEVQPGYFGQYGDQWIIPDDIVYDTTQQDAEKRSLLCFRHDGQVYYDSEAHGRIYFVDENVASQNEGTERKIKGYMAWDSVLANSNTQFDQETGQWRPVIQLPSDGYYDTVYFPASGGGPYWKWESPLASGDITSDGIAYGYQSNLRILLPKDDTSMYLKGVSASNEVGYMKIRMENSAVPGFEHDLIGEISAHNSAASNTYLEMSSWTQIKINDPVRFKEESASVSHTYYGKPSSPASDLKYYAFASSFSSPAAVSSGDSVVRFTGFGYDGSNYQNAVAIEFEIDGTVASAAMPGRIKFFTTASGASALTEVARITQLGDFQIRPNTVSNIPYISLSEFRAAALRPHITIHNSAGKFVIRDSDESTYPNAYADYNLGAIQWTAGTAANGPSIGRGGGVTHTLNAMFLDSDVTQAAGNSFIFRGTDGASSPSLEDWISIDYTGLLKLENSSIAYDDIPVYVDSLNAVPGLTGPTLTQYATNASGSTGIYKPAFSKTLANHVAGIAEVPHGAKRGTTLYPHYHIFIPADATSGASQIYVEFEHQIANVNELASGAGTTVENSTLVLPLDSTYTMTHKIATLTAITTTNQGNSIDPSASLVFRFARLGNNAADTYDDVAYITMVDFHYQIDTFGTRSVSAVDK